MKHLLLSALLLAGFGGHAQVRRQRVRESFQRHFKLLDSLAASSPSMLIQNCPFAIAFMEQRTGIKSPAVGSFFGKFDCYQTDLQAWHTWYAKRYGK